MNRENSDNINVLPQSYPRGILGSHGVGKLEDTDPAGYLNQELKKFTSNDNTNFNIDDKDGRLSSSPNSISDGPPSYEDNDNDNDYMIYTIRKSDLDNLYMHHDNILNCMRNPVSSSIPNGSINIGANNSLDALLPIMNRPIEERQSDNVIFQTITPPDINTQAYYNSLIQADSNSFAIDETANQIFIRGNLQDERNCNTEYKNNLESHNINLTNDFKMNNLQQQQQQNESCFPYNISVDEVTLCEQDKVFNSTAPPTSSNNPEFHKFQHQFPHPHQSAPTQHKYILPLTSSNEKQNSGSGVFLSGSQNVVSRTKIQNNSSDLANISNQGKHNNSAKKSSSLIYSGNTLKQSTTNLSSSSFSNNTIQPPINFGIINSNQSKQYQQLAANNVNITAPHNNDAISPDFFNYTSNPSSNSTTTTNNNYISNSHLNLFTNLNVIFPFSKQHAILLESLLHPATQCDSSESNSFLVIPQLLTSTETANNKHSSCLNKQQHHISPPPSTNEQDSFIHPNISPDTQVHFKLLANHASTTHQYNDLTKLTSSSPLQDSNLLTFTAGIDDQQLTNCGELEQCVINLPITIDSKYEYVDNKMNLNNHLEEQNIDGIPSNVQQNTSAVGKNRNSFLGNAFSSSPSQQTFDAPSVPVHHLEAGNKDQNNMLLNGKKISINLTNCFSNSSNLNSFESNERTSFQQDRLAKNLVERTIKEAVANISCIINSIAMQFSPEKLTSIYADQIFSVSQFSTVGDFSGVSFDPHLHKYRSRAFNAFVSTLDCPNKDGIFCFPSPEFAFEVFTSLFAPLIDVQNPMTMSRVISRLIGDKNNVFSMNPCNSESRLGLNAKFADNVLLRFALLFQKHRLSLEKIRINEASSKACKLIDHILKSTVSLCENRVAVLNLSLNINTIYEKIAEVIKQITHKIKLQILMLAARVDAGLPVDMSVLSSSLSPTDLSSLYLDEELDRKPSNQDSLGHQVTNLATDGDEKKKKQPNSNSQIKDDLFPKENPCLSISCAKAFILEIESIITDLFDADIPNFLYSARTDNPSENMSKSPLLPTDTLLNLFESIVKIFPLNADNIFFDDPLEIGNELMSVFSSSSILKSFISNNDHVIQSPTKNHSLLKFHRLFISKPTSFSYEQSLLFSTLNYRKYAKMNNCFDLVCSTENSDIDADARLETDTKRNRSDLFYQHSVPYSLPHVRRFLMKPLRIICSGEDGVYTSSPKDIAVNNFDKEVLMDDINNCKDYIDTNLYTNDSINNFSKKKLNENDDFETSSDSELSDIDRDGLTNSNDLLIAELDPQKETLTLSNMPIAPSESTHNVEIPVETRGNLKTKSLDKSLDNRRNGLNASNPSINSPSGQNEVQKKKKKATIKTVNQSIKDLRSAMHSTISNWPEFSQSVKHQILACDSVSSIVGERFSYVHFSILDEMCRVSLNFLQDAPATEIVSLLNPIHLAIESSTPLVFNKTPSRANSSSFSSFNNLISGLSPSPLPSPSNVVYFNHIQRLKNIFHPAVLPVAVTLFIFGHYVLNLNIDDVICTIDAHVHFHINRNVQSLAESHLNKSNRHCRTYLPSACNVCSSSTCNLTSSSINHDSQHNNKGKLLILFSEGAEAGSLEFVPSNCPDWFSDPIMFPEIRRNGGLRYFLLMLRCSGSDFRLSHPLKNVLRVLDRQISKASSIIGNCMLPHTLSNVLYAYNNDAWQKGPIARAVETLSALKVHLLNEMDALKKQETIILKSLKLRRKLCPQFALLDDYFSDTNHKNKCGSEFNSGAPMIRKRKLLYYGAVSNISQKQHHHHSHSSFEKHTGKENFSKEETENFKESSEKHINDSEFNQSHTSQVSVSLSNGRVHHCSNAKYSFWINNNENEHCNLFNYNSLSIKPLCGHPRSFTLSTDCNRMLCPSCDGRYISDYVKSHQNSPLTPTIKYTSDKTSNSSSFWDFCDKKIDIFLEYTKEIESFSLTSKVSRQCTSLVVLVALIADELDDSHNCDKNQTKSRIYHLNHDLLSNSNFSGSLPLETSYLMLETLLTFSSVCSFPLIFPFSSIQRMLPPLKHFYSLVSKECIKNLKIPPLIIKLQTILFLQNLQGLERSYNHSVLTSNSTTSNNTTNTPQKNLTKPTPELPPLVGCVTVLSSETLELILTDFLGFSAKIQCSDPSSANMVKMTNSILSTFKFCEEPNSKFASVYLEARSKKNKLLSAPFSMHLSSKYQSNDFLHSASDNTTTHNSFQSTQTNTKHSLFHDASSMLDSVIISFVNFLHSLSSVNDNHATYNTNEPELYSNEYTGNIQLSLSLPEQILWLKMNSIYFSSHFTDLSSFNSFTAFNAIKIQKIHALAMTLCIKLRNNAFSIFLQGIPFSKCYCPDKSVHEVRSVVKQRDSIILQSVLGLDEYWKFCESNSYYILCKFSSSGLDFDRNLLKKELFECCSTILKMSLIHPSIFSTLSKVLHFASHVNNSVVLGETLLSNSPFHFKDMSNNNLNSKAAHADFDSLQVGRLITQSSKLISDVKSRDRVIDILRIHQHTLRNRGSQQEAEESQQKQTKITDSLQKVTASNSLLFDLPSTASIILSTDKLIPFSFANNRHIDSAADHNSESSNSNLHGYMLSYLPSTVLLPHEARNLACTVEDYCLLECNDDHRLVDGSKFLHIFDKLHSTLTRYPQKGQKNESKCFEMCSMFDFDSIKCSEWCKSSVLRLKALLASLNSPSIRINAFSSSSYSFRGVFSNPSFASFPDQVSSFGGHIVGGLTGTLFDSSFQPSEMMSDSQIWPSSSTALAGSNTAIILASFQGCLPHILESRNAKWKSHEHLLSPYINNEMKKETSTNDEKLDFFWVLPENLIATERIDNSIGILSSNELLHLRHAVPSVSKFEKSARKKVDALSSLYLNDSYSALSSNDNVDNNHEDEFVGAIWWSQQLYHLSTIASRNIHSLNVSSSQLYEQTKSNTDFLLRSLTNRDNLSNKVSNLNENKIMKLRPYDEPSFCTNSFLSSSHVARDGQQHHHIHSFNNKYTTSFTTDSNDFKPTSPIRDTPHKDYFFNPSKSFDDSHPSVGDPILSNAGSFLSDQYSSQNLLSIYYNRMSESLQWSRLILRLLTDSHPIGTLLTLPKHFFSSDCLAINRNECTNAPAFLEFNQISPFRNLLLYADMLFSFRVASQSVQDELLAIVCTPTSANPLANRCIHRSATVPLISKVLRAYYHHTHVMIQNIPVLSNSFHQSDDLSLNPLGSSIVPLFESSAAIIFKSFAFLSDESPEEVLEGTLAVRLIKFVTDSVLNGVHTLTKRLSETIERYRKKKTLILDAFQKVNSFVDYNIHQQFTTCHSNGSQIPMSAPSMTANQAIEELLLLLNDERMHGNSPNASLSKSSSMTLNSILHESHHFDHRLKHCLLCENLPATAGTYSFSKNDMRSSISSHLQCCCWAFKHPTVDPSIFTYLDQVEATNFIQIVQNLNSLQTLRVVHQLWSGLHCFTEGKLQKWAIRNSFKLARAITARLPGERWLPPEKMDTIPLSFGLRALLHALDDGRQFLSFCLRTPEGVYELFASRTFAAVLNETFDIHCTLAVETCRVPAFSSIQRPQLIFKLSYANCDGLIKLLGEYAENASIFMNAHANDKAFRKGKHASASNLVVLDASDKVIGGGSPVSSLSIQELHQNTNFFFAASKSMPSSSPLLFDQISSIAYSYASALAFPIRRLFNTTRVVKLYPHRLSLSNAVTNGRRVEHPRDLTVDGLDLVNFRTLPVRLIGLYALMCAVKKWARDLYKDQLASKMRNSPKGEGNAGTLENEYAAIDYEDDITKLVSDPHTRNSFLHVQALATRAADRIMERSSFQAVICELGPALLSSYLKGLPGSAALEIYTHDTGALRIAGSSNPFQSKISASSHFHWAQNAVEEFSYFQKFEKYLEARSATVLSTMVQLMPPNPFGRFACTSLDVQISASTSCLVRQTTTVVNEFSRVLSSLIQPSPHSFQEQFLSVLWVNILRGFRLILLDGGPSRWYPLRCVPLVKICVEECRRRFFGWDYSHKHYHDVATGFEVRVPTCELERRRREEVESLYPEVARAEGDLSYILSIMSLSDFELLLRIGRWIENHEDSNHQTNLDQSCKNECKEFQQNNKTSDDTLCSNCNMSNDNCSSALDLEASYSDSLIHTNLSSQAVSSPKTNFFHLNIHNSQSTETPLKSAKTTFSASNKNLRAHGIIDSGSDELDLSSTLKSASQGRNSEQSNSNFDQNCYHQSLNAATELNFGKNTISKDSQIADIELHTLVHVAYYRSAALRQVLADLYSERLVIFFKELC